MDLVVEEKDGETNEVKIAGRGYEVYNHTILMKLQKFDQIVISCLPTYLEKAIHIIHCWESIGVVPQDSKVKFEVNEEEIHDKKTNGTYKKYLNKIMITKLPELFRFTQ